MYAVWYQVLSTTSTQLKDVYDLSQTLIGVAFLANGAGCLLSSFTSGWVMDRDYRIVTKQLANEGGTVVDPKNKPKDMNDLRAFPIEHARLRSAPYPFIVFCACTIGYGWSLESKVSIAIPLILQFFIGFSSTFVMSLISTLIVDLKPGKGGQITASNNLIRCLAAAGAVTFIQPLIDAVNIGWAFTLMSGLLILFTPLPIWVWISGMKWRNEEVEVRE